MQRTPVTSSNVASVGYDAETRILEVEYKGKGDVYQYHDVKPEVYAALLAASSIGSFIAHSVKPWHPVTKLASAPVDPTSQRERLAAVSHEIWSHWMRWMFAQGMYEANGTWTLPEGLVDRWQRQMTTDYADLTEREKDSDREQAEKILAVLETTNLT